jgi:hypothetical protein
MPENQKNKLSEASPSVQAHLGILQNVIDRMSSNSNSTKAWCGMPMEPRPHRQGCKFFSV